MRVLITTDSFPPGCGGSGWSTYELARGLRGAGHHVLLVHAVAGGADGRERLYDGFTIQEQRVASVAIPFVRNYLKNERSYRRLVPILRCAIRENAVDVVHAQHVLTAPPSVEAARLENVPVVCTIRDYWPVCYWSDLIHDPSGTELCPGCTNEMMRRCVRPRAGHAWPLALPFVPYMASNLRAKRAAVARSSAIVAVSSVLARDLVSRAPELAGTRIEMIPNPVDVDAITEAARSVHPLDGRPYAIYVGKLARNKGVGSLVPAVERARLPWPLIVVGDGPERDSIAESARQSAIDVRLLGWLERSDALRWLAHASAVVFPSYGPESLSRVLLEASVLGRPIAAMNTGGTADIIIDGETGLLARTASDLGDALARLVADRPLAESLGQRASRFVRRQFSASSVVARMVALYADLRADAGEAVRG